MLVRGVPSCRGVDKVDTPLLLLRAIGQALQLTGTDTPPGERLPEVAATGWSLWASQASHAQRQTELALLGRLSLPEVHRYVEPILAELLPAQEAPPRRWLWRNWLLHVAVQLRTLVKAPHGLPDDDPRVDALLLGPEGLLPLLVAWRAGSSPGGVLAPGAEREADPSRHRTVQP